MDTIATLVDLVHTVVRSYATAGYRNGQPSRLYYLENVEDHVFIVAVPYNPAYKRADLVVMVRIVNDQVVIDADKTSKPIYDELRRAGIPENQIVAAWALKSERTDRP